MVAANVFSLVEIVAVGVSLGTVLLCTLAVVAGLRSFGLDVPFSLSSHVFKRKTPELLEALKGRSINTYVLVSGLLLFAFPLFAGLTAYDYVVRRYIEHSAYKLNNLAWSVVLLAVLGIVGVWTSLRQWQKSVERGIGIPFIAILVLKLLTNTLGAMTVLMLVLPSALCAVFVYLAIRRIRRPFTERRYSSRSDQRVVRNFISEQFVPNEQYKAQQRFMAQSLPDAEVSADAVPDRPLHHVDRPTTESPN